MTWKPDDSNVVAKVFSTELRTNASLLCEFEHLGFKFNIAKCVTRFAARSWQRIEIVGTCKFRGLHCKLGGRATDNNCQVVRRACCGTECFHFVKQPRQQGLLIEQCFCLLKQITLVGRTATLGYEKKFVFVTVNRSDFDFGRKIGVGVDFFKHRQRCKLAVAKVACLIRVVDAMTDCCVVATTGEHTLTFFCFDNCSARVLTHRQNATSSDACILQQIKRNKTIVVASFRVFQNACQLLQVRRT